MTRTFDIITRVEIDDENEPHLARRTEADTDELAADTAANIVAREIDICIAHTSELRDVVTVVRHEVKEIL